MFYYSIHITLANKIVPKSRDIALSRETKVQEWRRQAQMIGHEFIVWNKHFIYLAGLLGPPAATIHKLPPSQILCCYLTTATPPAVVIICNCGYYAPAHVTYIVRCITIMLQIEWSVTWWCLVVGALVYFTELIVVVYAFILVNHSTHTFCKLWFSGLCIMRIMKLAVTCHFACSIVFLCVLLRLNNWKVWLEAQSFNKADKCSTLIKVFKGNHTRYYYFHKFLPIIIWKFLEIKIAILYTESGLLCVE